MSEGLLGSHCICSVALVTMATSVEIKRAIVSDSGGKCVLMWVWGKQCCLDCFSLSLFEMPQTLNNDEKEGGKSLSQSARNFAQVAPSFVYGIQFHC